MEKFFALCGELVSYETIKSGSFPKTTFTGHWVYVNGEAWFDGLSWTFRVNK